MIELKHRVKMGIEAGKVDLSKWLFSMSNNDYVNSSRNHKRYCVSKQAGGKSVIISEESAGGTHVVHRYEEVESATNHVKVVSENSRALIFYLISIQVKVIWDLKIIPTSDKDSELECYVQINFPNAFLEFLARMAFSRYFWTKHCIEETEGFKYDILIKNSARF